jgi:hypothetical protein
MAAGNDRANRGALAPGIRLGRNGSRIPDGVSKRAETAFGLALSLIVASWVTADARKRARKIPYDFDSWVFFAWPVILPVYLLQTRKLRIFLTLLFFIGVCLLAWAGAFVAVWLQKG